MHLLRILLLVVACCSPPTLGYCFRSGIKGNYAADKRIFDRKDAGKNEVRTIDVAECVGGMELQAKCKHGGTKAYQNWGYLADPNEGECLSGPLG
ncbi:hypothetical protein CSOJ01_02379 [Colletotrichum sojae]|uniref:Uncharacterized protein n=1 Tax=Colletotrichum sojae TaxID=2175907 RepID=A0A8H6N215_9PEZI|nr:hypothetical protein CSOJ01_02379 [Colletotrichum sojae]